jgi:hypothetical protein
MDKVCKRLVDKNGTKNANYDFVDHLLNVASVLAIARINAPFLVEQESNRSRLS